MNNTANKNNLLCEEDLKQFTGTEDWYQHLLFRKYLYTDGMKHVAEQGSAYWLIDKIFIEQIDNSNLLKQQFQVWVLSVNDDMSAVLKCHDGNYNWQHEETIPYTDFPLKQIALYFADNVLLLPSEY